MSQEIQPVRALDVDRETGEIAILKDRALAIAANQEGLEEIDSRELTQPAGKDQPYLSYRYFRHPANLTLDVTKHELEGVVRTVVSRGYVEAVVSSEGPVSVRARYWVKSSERQRLAVTLPALRLLGVTVAGRSVLPEKAPQSPSAAPEDKTYFVNIDRQTGPDEAFPIALVYEAPAPPSGKLGVTDQLRLRLPQFENGVKFQQLYVRLWLPEEYRAIGEPPGFDAETRLVLGQRGFQHFTTAPEEPGTWFPGDSAAFDFRTAGRSYLYGSLTAPEELVVRYWKFASMTLAGSLAVMFAGVVLLAFRFESRVLLLLTAVLGCFLAGMFWPESVAAWLIAARIGGAGVLALWLVIFLLRVRRAIPMRAAAASAGAVLIGTVATSPGTVTGEPPPAPGPPSAQAQDHPSNQPGQNNVRGKEKGGSRDA